MEARGSSQKKPSRPIRSRGDTREKILQAALDLLLKQGFDGTSIDQILLAAGVTKGAFFHYFKSKEELGQAVMTAFVEADQKLAADLLERATKLSRDPLQQVLIMVGLLAEMFEGLTEPHPGCLIASYCYQKNLMTEPLRAVAAKSLLEWRELLVQKLEEAAAEHKLRRDVDLKGIADLLNTIIEGAFVMSKTLREPKLVAEQLTHYRNYLELLFEGRSSIS